MSTILVVCTGNVCRSPVAEGGLRLALAERLGGAAPRVASAGTAGWEGSPATDGSVEAARGYGIDLSGHVARMLTPGMIEGAELVIGMAREHRTAVTRSLPSAAARTFTLKEVVPLLEAVPADPAFPPLRDRVAQADALRSSEPREGGAEQDVADPLGMPIGVYRAMAGELVALTERLAGGLFGPAKGSDPTSSVIHDPEGAAS